MSSISKEVFEQLIPIRILYKIIDDTNVSLTSVKHDFSIRRKALVNLYAWNFLNQRTKHVWLMSTIKPNNFSAGFIMM